MQIGIQLPQMGPTSTPDAVRTSAHAAEALGYHSVWATDRLTPPAGLDPVATLAYAAAVTERVRLAMHASTGPLHPTRLLSRSLASLDLLSDGRLTAALDADDDALDALEASWAANPKTFALVPVQRPRPPLLLTDIEQVARRGDGWYAAGIPVDVLARLHASIRDLAASHGRDPDALALVVRATTRLTADPVDGRRADFEGSLEQISADLHATKAAGACEVVLDVAGEHGLDATLEAYATLAEVVELDDRATCTDAPMAGAA